MMKQILFITFLVLAFMACEEKVDRYAGESGMYFDMADMRMDTMFIPWGLKNSDIKEQKIRLKVCLFGDVMPHDRNFKVEIIADETDTLRAVENVDYKTFSTDCKIPANEAWTYIDVTLLRTEALINSARRFTIRLVENDDLKFLFTRELPVQKPKDETPVVPEENPEVTPEENPEETPEEEEVELRPLDYQRVIYMDERFKVPNWWPVCGKSIFGDYSAKKCILICDVMGIDREAFIAPFSMTNTISQGYLSYVGKYMHRWLQENPQTEEDGKPMEMGQASRN